MRIKTMLAAAGILVFLPVAAMTTTISLPGDYERSPADIMVLDDNMPDRLIVYNLENLLGNDIVFAVRFGNLNAMNEDFGDIPTAGAFGVFHDDELLISQNGILDCVFGGIEIPASELVDEDGILRLSLQLLDDSDPLAFYRPWLYITDDVPPAATEDLEVVRSFPTQLRLHWTAAGDDGLEGTAAMYEIRYSKWPVEDIEEWWGYAEQARDVPYPDEPGSEETSWITDLDTVSTYYIVLVTYDEVGNRSDFSNVASGTTGEDTGPEPGENYCLHYNGENSFAQVPFNPILNPPDQITVEAWYKTTEEFVYLQQCIIDKPFYEHQFPAYQYLMAPYSFEADGPDYFFAWLTTDGQGHGMHVQDVGERGVWVHCAMTFDGETKRLYIDGELVGSYYQPGHIDGYETGIRFGRLTNLDLWNFNGFIDEIRIWDVARTQQQIQQTMNIPLIGDEPGLIAYWNFDEGGGQSILDITGNGSDGYLGLTPEVDENDPVWVESDAPIEYLRTDNYQDWSPNIPVSFALSQNYPNPFNAETKISFELPRRDHVTVEIFDMLGRRVRILADDFYDAGSHLVTWDGRSDSGESLSSGLYFYSLKSNEFQETRKMLMLK
jgi:hypothetical protein